MDDLYRLLHCLLLFLLFSAVGQAYYQSRFSVWALRYCVDQLYCDFCLLPLFTPEVAIEASRIKSLQINTITQ